MWNREMDVIIVVEEMSAMVVIVASLQRDR